MPLSPAVFNQLLKGVRPTGGLTETEAATIPYARAVEEKKVAERNRIQPLRMLFDLLSRGQYASANMVDEIIQSIQTGEPFGQSVKDALAGVLRGLKGEEKGDYEDILRKYLPKEILEKWEKPILGEKQEGKFLIGATPIGVLGFLGNVLLDPLTWVGFGPAKGARSVSDDFAKDIIKVKLKKLGIQGTDTLNNLQKIAREGFSEEVVQKALKSAPEQAAKYLDNVGAKKVSEYLNKTYKEARKFALRKPAAELQQRMQQELSEIGMSKLPALAPEMVKGWELEELLKKTYQGAGTRAGRFMGKEFAVGVREPWHIQQWDTFTQKVAQSPPGQLFGKAIKAAADWGPVASFRKRFGIRNPYQKYLRSIELEESAPVLNRVSNSKAWEYMNFRQKYGDDVVKNVQNIIEQAEDIGIEGIDFFSLYGKTDDEMNKFATELTGMLDNIRAAEREAAAKGLFGDGTVLKSIDNYLPTKYDITEGVLQGGARKTSPTATRVFTRAERVDVNAKVTSWLFGVDLEQARSLIQNHGMSNYATNLDELMMWRIYGHSKLMERANIVEQFREFGIPIDELEGAMRTATEEFRGGIQQLGLRKIDDPAYKGFVFDKDVADIIENVNKATGPGSVQEMKAIWTRWTSWWRGMVTMTTGFHARNFLSNNATGFMKHGAKWFRMAEYDAPALAGTLYALGKENPEALLKHANMDNAMLKRLLNKRMGNYTVKELADYSLQKGVISQATMGFDVEDVAETFFKKKKTLNPLSRKFIGTDISHKLGSVVESQARFKSFLIDYSDIARTGIDETGQKAALEWAKKEAKKFWIDYTDLTPWEQKYMKNVIPFYCFPIDTEILTENGWKCHGEVEKGERALTYNVEKDYSEWQKIEDIAVFDFDGDLSRLKGQWADFVCTKDHRWPVHVYGGWHNGIKSKPYRKIVRTHKLRKQYCLITSCPHVNTNNETLMPPNDAATLGWLLTDGLIRYRKSYIELRIVQKKIGNVEHIRHVAKEYITSEYKPKNDCIEFRISSDFVNKYKEYFVPKENLIKILPRLSTESLEAMYDAMFRAEGSIHRTGYIKRVETWIQSENITLDVFQMLCYLLGKFWKPYKRRIKYNGTDKYYYKGYLSKRKHIHVGSIKIKDEYYKGKIWCPKVANSTVLIRQNKKTIWSGQTWLRYNIGNQVSGILSYPEMYSMFPKLQEAAKLDDPDFDPTFIPEWMKQLGMFPVSKGPEGKFRMFRPDFPFGDINKIPLLFEEGKFLPRFNLGELRDDILAATHPWIKQTFEVLVSKEGYDTFYKSQMPPTRRVPLALRVVAKFPRATQFLDGLLRSRGREGGLYINEDDKGKLHIDSKVGKIIEENMPLFKTLENIMLLGSAAIPGLEQLFEEKLDIKDDYEDLEHTFQVLSRWAGIKFKEADWQKEKELLRKEIYNEANEQRLKAMGTTPSAQLRSKQRKETLEKKMRRVVGF